MDCRIVGIPKYGFIIRSALDVFGKEIEAECRPEGNYPCFISIAVFDFTKFPVLQIH